MSYCSSIKSSDKKHKTVTVDRLAIFLHKIASDTKEEAVQTEQVNEILQQLYTQLFTQDSRFSTTFERPPSKHCIEKGEFLEYRGNNQFTCRLMLKKFTSPDTTQVMCLLKLSN